MSERGLIYNRARAAQLRDFSGLRYGKITPTDIDSLIDFGGRAFVLVETKRRGNGLPFGQRLALERVTDGLAGQAAALALVAEHDTPPSADIDFARCVVVEYRLAGRWRTPRQPCSVREAIDVFLRKYGLDFYLSA